MNKEQSTREASAPPPPLEVVNLQSQEPGTPDALQLRGDPGDIERLQHAVNASFKNWFQMINTMVSAFPGYAVQRTAYNWQELVDRTEIRRPDALQERLRKAAIEQVLTGTEWLTSRHVGKLAGVPAANLHAAANRLLQQGRVFALKRRGQYEYPRYAFDDLGEPLPGLAPVLEEFKGYSALRIASWFESTNGMLGGRRPREVLAEDPQAVLAAAQDHRAGVLHG